MTYIFMRRVVVQPLRQKSFLNLETFLKLLNMVSLHFFQIKIESLNSRGYGAIATLQRSYNQILKLDTRQSRYEWWTCKFCSWNPK